MTPIDLRLFSGEWLVSQKDLGLGSWSDHPDEAGQGPLASSVAAINDHVVDSGGPELGIVLERFLDEELIGIEHCRHWWPVGRTGTQLANDPIDNVGMETELSRDGPLLPVLGKEEATNRGFEIAIDHRGTSDLR
jgi:hypothetical protein